MRNTAWFRYVPVEGCKLLPPSVYFDFKSRPIYEKVAGSTIANFRLICAYIVTCICFKCQYLGHSGQKITIMVFQVSPNWV